MARSKSTTGEKTTRSRANSKTQKVEDQSVNAGIPAASDANAPAHNSSFVTPSEEVSAKSAIAQETRPRETAHESNSPEARKLGVVKSEPRKHVVVPINLDDEIRRRAYELYQQRGSSPGSEAEDWFTAEREVRDRYQQQQHSA
jgi:hypothetical protein